MTEDSPTETATKRKTRFYQLLSTLLGVTVLVLLVIVINQSTASEVAESPSANPSDTTNPPAGEEPSGDSPIVRRIAGDPMALGELDAPVVLSIWTDLRCPFCALFEQQTMPLIIQEYVQTGKVRLEIHDVIFFGEQSEDAAVAARAAANQGKFFDYLDAVYAAAPADGHPDLPKEKLIEFAQTIEIPDLDRFTTELTQPELHNAVRQSTSNAVQLGIDSVPFFIANNTAMIGAHPIEEFRDFLNQALNSVK